MARPADHVAAAKLWLISEARGPDGPRHLPYLAQALYALATVESGQVATVAADERWRLYVNPAWVVEADVGDLGRELAHQVWHLLMEHADRARSMDVTPATMGAWHQACDLTIVEALGPDGAVGDDLLAAAADIRRAHPTWPRDRGAEEYYALLSRLEVSSPSPGAGGSGGGAGDPSAPDPQGPEDEPPPDTEGSAADGRPRPWELPADADVGALAEVGAHSVRTAVAVEYRAFQAGRRGDTPGDAARWARKLTEPRIPWERLLAQATRQGVGWTSGRHEPTWTRASRRASATRGILQPGWRRPNPRVACVVDTSGSVDDLLLGQAMGEVEGALRALGVAGAELTVLACDAAVQAVTRVRRARDAVLAGAGGTDLRVGLAAIERLRPRPSLVVVFTDGYTPWPATPPPGAAVVVALLTRPGDQPPDVPGWATAIRCELDA